MTTTPIIKNHIPFESLVFRRYPLKSLVKNKIKAAVGLDTETLNGYCKLLTTSDGEYKYTASFLDCMEVLTSHRLRDSANFFFNLNYDVNAIIKYLPTENITEMAQRGKTKYLSFSLFYIPRKLFRIITKKHSYRFYDIFQFYDMSLEKASQKYLAEKKYIVPIDPVKLGSSARYWKKHRADILTYCLNDSRLTARLGQLLIDTLTTNLQLQPQSFVSKAAITKEMLRKAVKIPSILDLEPGVISMAFNAYSGGRFEILQKGAIGPASLYDINSAYPSIIRELVDINQGRWIKTKSLHEEAHYGFYLVKLLTNYNTMAPFPFRLPNGVISYPILEKCFFTTKEELLAYEKYIDYEILIGWEYYPDKLIYPFKDYIDKLFALKSQAEPDSYSYQLYKIMANSVYGCFYEKHKAGLKWMVGKLFNPIYATLITAGTRIEVFDFAMPHRNDTVGFATDSVLLKGSPEIYTSKKLGGWSLQKKGNTVVLRSGIYKIDDSIKSRGLKKVAHITTPDGEFKDIFDYIRRKPDNTSYTINTMRPLNFREVIQHHKVHCIDDINIFTNVPYVVDINTDYKRLWNDTFSTGGQLFEKTITSEPLLLTNS